MSPRSLFLPLLLTFLCFVTPNVQAVTLKQANRTSIVARHKHRTALRDVNGTPIKRAGALAPRNSVAPYLDCGFDMQPGYAVYRDDDIHGHDIGGGSAEASPDECAAFCAASSECDAWTMNVGDPNSSLGCNLKTNYGAETPIVTAMTADTTVWWTIVPGSCEEYSSYTYAECCNSKSNPGVEIRDTV